MAQICHRLLARPLVRQIAFFSRSTVAFRSTAIILRSTTNGVKILSSSQTEQRRFFQKEAERVLDQTKKPTKSEVGDRVMKAIKTFDRLPKDKELKMATHFMNDLGLDSLDHVEIIMTIEEEFNIEIPDSDAENLLTPQQIFDYVCNKVELAVVA